MTPLRREVERLLEAGSRCEGPKTAETCRDILKRREALWTFVQVGPPATNTGKFTVRLFDSLPQPLHVDFYRHVQWVPVSVTLSMGCQRCGPDEIGAIGDNMGKG